jgi:heparan-alpha-glucosaminide N-acetyltransferase
MEEKDRLYSIDLMRGLVLLLMLVANGLKTTGTTLWSGQPPAEFSFTDPSGWIFPVFLFISGMVIPLSLGRRISEGQDTYTIVRHIIVRSLSLVIIGVLMINIDRINPEFTGFGKSIWALLMYAGVFLVWNSYPQNEQNFFTVAGLRLAGIALLAALVFKFRSGEFVNGGSLITGWWGIPGIIGMAYLIPALIYFVVKDNILNISVAWLFFFALDILTKAGVMGFPEPVRPFLGVITDGRFPAIVLSGVITTLILSRYSKVNPSKAYYIGAAGIISIIAGLILRNGSAFLKIGSAPGGDLICIGICILLFTAIRLLAEWGNNTRLTSLIIPAGQNSFTAYILAEIVYYISALTGLPLLFFKSSGYPLVAVGGSVVLSVLILWLTTALVRLKISLKL